MYLMILTTRQYYTGVPISLNDGKGAGPFMYAASEYDLATAKNGSMNSNSTRC
jgi:hypothetical protein